MPCQHRVYRVEVYKTRIPDGIGFRVSQWLSVEFQAPCLELDDGAILTHSNAISHYYVEQAGMLPSDPRRIANTHDLISVFQDLRCFVFVAVL